MLISLKLKVFFLFTFLFGTCKSDYAIYNIPTSTLESSKSLSTTTKAKNIALTFDDGPHGILTPKLLDILNETNSKATFFIMGVKAHLHPNVLRRMVTEGHEIGNHGWNHPVMSKLTHDQVHQQLATTANAIQNVTDTTPTNMRPPYGNTNNKLNRYIAVKEKLGVIMWSLDTLDWQRPSPDTIVKRVLEQVKEGDIILCHDIHPGTITAVEMFVRNLTAQGFKFQTISQLLPQK